MALSVKITISGDKETQAKLIKLGPALTNFTDAMRSIGSELKGFYSGQVFSSQGAALGKAWTPLAAKTKLYKSKHWAGAGPEIRTGTMKKSFVFDADTKQVTISNTAEYFPYQQLGTGYGGAASFGIGNGGGAHIGRGRNLPARPMIGVNATVKDIIYQIVNQDVQAKLAKAGL